MLYSQLPNFISGPWNTWEKSDQHSLVPAKNIVHMYLQIYCVVQNFKAKPRQVPRWPQINYRPHWGQYNKANTQLVQCNLKKFGSTSKYIYLFSPFMTWLIKTSVQNILPFVHNFVVWITHFSLKSVLRNHTK